MVADAGMKRGRAAGGRRKPDRDCGPDIVALVGDPRWGRTRSGAVVPRGSLQDMLTEAVPSGRIPAPWLVQLHHTDAGLYMFEVHANGSVRVFVRQGRQEVLPPGSIPVAQLPVIAAHQGAGTTVWAHLLGGREILGRAEADGPALVVARSTLAGVEAAKRFTREAGAVLIVADAAGTPPDDVRRAIRVLSGAAPVVRAPWIPALRGMMTVPDNAAVNKTAARVAAAVRTQWRDNP